MDIQKILFVTNFDELQFDALRSLLDLRDAALNHVVFLNVIQRDTVAMKRGAGYRKEEEIRLREKANIRFIDWAETLFEQGMEVGVYITVGSFVRQVITAAEKEGVDLIVMGPEKKGKIEQLYAGSDIAEIIHQATCPVLVYKYLSPDGKITDKPFDRPLFATDWSASGDRALACLKRLKGVIKHMDVIHVADEKALKGDSAMAIQKTRKECREKLDQICEALEAEGIDAKAHVYIGDAVTEIENAARECQSTLIVAGISGKGYWKERWIGSKPRQLAEKSAFPTLLIPAGADPDGA